MKFLTQTLGFLLSVLLFIGMNSCSSSTEETAKEVKTEINLDNIVVADYTIEGMVCAMGCAKTIQDEVAKMNGVASCNVNYEEKTAHVEFDGEQLSENELIALIEGLVDGKYKVIKTEDEVAEESLEEDVGSGEASEKSVVEVSLPNFEIPNLFELLFKQL